MPKRREPQSLGSLALTTFENLILQYGSLTTTAICIGYQDYSLEMVKAKRRKQKQHFEDRQQKQCMLHQKMKSDLLPWLREAVDTIPNQFADELTRDVVKYGNEMIKDHIKIDPDMIHHRCYCWIKDFVKSCLHRSSETISLQNLTSQMQEVVCNEVNYFSNLRVLYLPSDEYFSFTNMVAKGILNLKLLVSFSFQWDCTDMVLYYIAKHCTNLKNLDISNSASVTTESIPHIQKLQNLQTLNVNRTTLAQECVLELLERLPFLEGIYSPDTIILQSPQIFPCLLSVSITAEVSAIPHMCPNLSYLSICPDTYTDDASILGGLKSLKHLSINNCSFEASNIKGLVKLIGKQLLSLELNMIDDVNAEIISSYCTNLTSLSYLNCTFHVMLTSFTILNQLSHYENLLNLTLHVHGKDEKINDFPLLNFPNLHKLHLVGMKSFNDKTISEAIVTNCWKNLKTLCISNCGYLTMKYMILLLDHCDDLSEVSGVDKQTPFLSYENFELYLRKNNINVKLM